ncbi:putative uncharacterized protein DDB_G0282133 [Octopus bimaculoides]|uniref:putative uncharacterized protein DDB_G0282133 n=1 Tax=Octopus bimaculoides TaxID=37653 RepID=UPI00071CC502|nr:putative uncharacterized protein DDB_G0282133 [Octopus bimaculoides]|eukprot:XP_014775964.1 PREDICTED: putative uncharacterized protein DDB_G0282133 [Octopus bimaculoides]
MNNPYTQFKALKISNHNIRPITRTKPRENIETFTPASWNVVRSTKEIADQNSDTTKLTEIENHGQESERLLREKIKSSTNLYGVNDVIFLDMKDVINDEDEERNSSPNQSTDSLYENLLDKRERSLDNDSSNETTIQNVKVTKQISENQDRLWQFGDTEETTTDNNYTTVLPENKKNSKMYFSPETTIDYDINNVEDDKENVLPSSNLYSTTDELLQNTEESILLDRIDKTYPPNLPNQTELLSSLIAKDILRWEQRTKTKSNAMKSNNGNDSKSSTGAQANTDHSIVSDDNRFISGNITDARVNSELFPLISNQTHKEIEDVQTLTSCNDTDLNCKLYNESNALLVNSSLSENTYLTNINNTIDNNGIIGGLKSHSSYGNSETTTHLSGIAKDHSNKIINSLKDSKQASIVTANSSEIVLNPNLSNHLQFDNSLKMSSNSNEAITKEIFSKYYTHLEDNNLTTNTPVFRSNDSANILKKNPTHYISRNSLKHDIEDSRSESNSLVKSLLEQKNKLDQSLNQQRKSSSLNYNDGNKLNSYKNDFHPTTSKIGFRENAKNTVRNELPMLLLPRENNSKERKYKQLFPESGELNNHNVGSGDTQRENYYLDNKSFEKNFVNSNPVRNLQTNAKSVLSTNILKQLVSANQNYNQLPTQISVIFPENDNPVEDDDNNNNYNNDFMPSKNYPMPYHNRNLTKAVSISIQGGNLSTKSISEAELPNSGDFVLQINATEQSIDDDELEENNATGIVHDNASENSSQEVRNYDEPRVKGLNDTSETVIENKISDEEKHLDEIEENPQIFAGVTSNTVSLKKSVKRNSTLEENLNLDNLKEDQGNSSNEENLLEATSLSEQETITSVEQPTTVAYLYDWDNLTRVIVDNSNFTQTDNLNFTVDSFDQIDHFVNTSETSDPIQTSISNTSVEINSTNANPNNNITDLNTNQSEANSHDSVIKTDKSISIEGADVDYEASLKSKLKLLLKLTESGESANHVNETRLLQRQNSENNITSVTNNDNYYSEDTSVSVENLMNNSMISRKAIKNTNFTTADFVDVTSSSTNIKLEPDKELSENEPSLMISNKSVSVLQQSNTSQSINAYLPHIVFDRSNIGKINSLSFESKINNSHNISESDAYPELNSSFSEVINTDRNASINPEFSKNKSRKVSHNSKETIPNYDQQPSRSENIINESSSVELVVPPLLKMKERSGNHKADEQSTRSISLISNDSKPLTNDYVTNDTTTENYLSFEFNDSKSLDDSESILGFLNETESNDITDLDSQLTPNEIKYSNNNFTESITKNVTSFISSSNVFSSFSSEIDTFLQGHTNVSASDLIIYQNQTRNGSDVSHIDTENITDSLNLQSANSVKFNQQKQTEIYTSTEDYKPVDKSNISKIVQQTIDNSTELENNTHFDRQHNSSFEQNVKNRPLHPEENLMNKTFLSMNRTFLNINNSLDEFLYKGNDTFNQINISRENQSSLEYKESNSVFKIALPNEDNSTAPDTAIGISRQDSGFKKGITEFASNNSEVYNDSNFNQSISANLSKNWNLWNEEIINDIVTNGTAMNGVGINRNNSDLELSTQAKIPSSETKILEEQNLKGNSFSNLTISTMIYMEEMTNNGTTMETTLNRNLVKRLVIIHVTCYQLLTFTAPQGS